MSNLPNPIACLDCGQEHPKVECLSNSECAYVICRNFQCRKISRGMATEASRVVIAIGEFYRSMAELV